MNTKIKLFGVGLIVLAGLFAGAGLASAQTATVASCNSATVSATLTDTGGAVTSVWFEWGTNFSTVSAGSGSRTVTQSFSSAPQNVTQLISGLSQSTVYYYRVVFSNVYGTSQSGPLSFTTPSCAVQNNQATSNVITNSASLVTQNSATLNGYVASNAVNTSAWFEWGTSNSLGNTTPSNSYGTNGSNFSYAIFNLAPNTTYYFRAVGQGALGPVYGSTLSFTTSGQNNNNNNNNNNTQPYVSTNSASSVTQNSATLNGYVTSSGTNTSAWFEWGTSYSLGNTTPSISYGTGPTSFNSPLFSLSANTTYYFRAVAQSSYGTVYGSTLSFTTSGQTTSYNYNTGVAPTVTTLLATELTGTTARLNGLVFTTASQSSNAWFEWGATSNLGNTTQSTNVGALPTVKHSDFITGLVSGQTYYYRIVAENTYGRVYGSTSTFVSVAASTYVAPVSQTVYVAPRVTTPVVLKPTTIVVTRGSSAQSLVELSIDGGTEAITSGEKRSYHVVWKNVSAQSLRNVVLRVTFPQTMTFNSTTKGAFSSADNAVTVDINTLAPNETGDVFITATTDNGLKVGELLVVTANMVYTSADGVQGDAIAYVTHRAEASQNGIGANIFGAGDFLPTTLFGWILLLLLVLILVFLGNHLYGRFSDERH